MRVKLIAFFLGVLIGQAGKALGVPWPITLCVSGVVGWHVGHYLYRP